MGLLATLATFVVLLAPSQDLAWRPVWIAGEDAGSDAGAAGKELERRRAGALRQIARLQLRPHDPREVEALRAEARRAVEEQEAARRSRASAPPPAGALRCVALPVPEELRAPVLGLSFDPRGERLAVLLEGARFLVFERAAAGQWALTSSLAAPSGAFLMAARPAWESITLVGIDSLVHLVPRGWREIRVPLTHWVCEGAMHADGLLLRSGDNRIHLVAPSASLREIYASPHDLRVIAARPTERGFWVAQADGELRRLAFDGLLELRIQSQCPSDPTALLEDRDSGWLLVGHANGGVHLYEGGVERAAAILSSAPIRSICPARLGSRRWIALCADGGLAVFTLHSRGGDRTLAPLDRVRPTDPATAVSASPMTIAMGTRGGRVLLASVQDWPALTPGRE